MPYNSQDFSCDELCSGRTISVKNREKLIEVLAHLLLGRYLHAKKILESFGHRVTPQQSEKDAVIKKLIVTEQWQVWHRDGWLFQGMSWIALQSQYSGHFRTSVPHPQTSFKGLDALTIKFDDQGQEIEFVTIGEDKATENPRKTIRDEVWPSLKAFESGERNSEIISAVTELLEKQSLSQEAITRNIENFFWIDQKRYHIAITVTSTHDSDSGRKKLFKQFDTTVSGSSARRTATTIHFEDIRSWMDLLANDLKDYINNL